jgi:hypothetical protein
MAYETSAFIFHSELEDSGSLETSITLYETYVCISHNIHQNKNLRLHRFFWQGMQRDGNHKSFSSLQVSVWRAHCRTEAVHTASQAGFYVKIIPLSWCVSFIASLFHFYTVMVWRKQVSLFILRNDVLPALYFRVHKYWLYWQQDSRANDEFFFLAAFNSQSSFLILIDGV